MSLPCCISWSYRDSSECFSRYAFGGTLPSKVFTNTLLVALTFYGLEVALKELHPIKKGESMKLRVLGCSGSEFPGHYCSAFLLNDTLLLDAGTIGAVLTAEEQWAITNILLTHRHLDHLKALPLLADNINIQNLRQTVRVYGLRDTLAALRNHLMNNSIWPDFSRFPNPEQPIIRYEEITASTPFLVEGFEVTAFLVAHTVPAVGYILRKDGKGILYTGDTGPTELIWRMAVNLSAIIVEVSFPNALEELALRTGHLTPRLLTHELDKLSERPGRILVTHRKHQYFSTIIDELANPRIPGLELLKEGDRYEF